MSSQSKSGNDSAKSSLLVEPGGRVFFYILAVAALAFALVAGWRTVTDWDLGWQIATGRWIVQHHHVPSTDVLSYTGQGKSWIYPVGSCLVFYYVFLVGGYTALTVLGTVACVTVVGLLLRRGSWITAALAVVAIPAIAARTTPRSEIFSVIFFAAYLSILWEQFETGRARLWLLPVFMVAWVNLHLGLTAGVALIVGYLFLEFTEMIWAERRAVALGRVRRAWPWFVVSLGAVLLNPWGWRTVTAAFGFMSPMAGSSANILEWEPVRLRWAAVVSSFSLRIPNPLILLLCVVAIAIPIALVRKRWGAAIWLCGATYCAMSHMRLLVMFSIVVVVVAGSILTEAVATLRKRLPDQRTFTILCSGICSMMVLLTTMWAADTITGRAYIDIVNLSSFGTGPGWWFPEKGAAFIEREKLPGRIFNTYDEGGYILWRLGEEYQDYVDGRGNPFGADGIKRSLELVQMSPNSADWQHEAERYDINTIIVPLGRYFGVEEFPLLRQFCTSENWRPVFLDETSAVFLRSTPANQELIHRLQIDCRQVPIPSVAPSGRMDTTFNEWANSAVVLKALGRDAEAFTASANALAIYPGDPQMHATRARVLEQSGNLQGAEQEYRASLQNGPIPSTWMALAKLYEFERRTPEAIDSWNHVLDLAPEHSGVPLLSLGFDDLDAGSPKGALQAFERSQTAFQKEFGTDIQAHRDYYANLAHGQASAWKALHDLSKAIHFEEETVRITPERRDDWLELAALYESAGRPMDATRARQQAETLIDNKTVR